MRQFLTVVAAVVSFAAPAHADSDGYFCVGRSYIAYQFGMADPSTAPHRLYVVGFHDRDEMGDAAIVELPHFQVHGMLCTDSAIQVVSFDSVYTVLLHSSSTPIGIKRTPLATRGQIPQTYLPQRNLGVVSRPVNTLQVERTVLARVPGGRTFLLEISPRAAEEPCTTEITTRLLNLDARGALVGARLLFEGKVGRECGE